MSMGIIKEGEYNKVAGNADDTKKQYPLPDWANRVIITGAQLTAGYTAPADGLFCCSPLIVTGWITINAPGVTVAVGRPSSDANAQFPVAKGDVINAVLGGGATFVEERMYFVPWK